VKDRLVALYADNKTFEVRVERLDLEAHPLPVTQPSHCVVVPRLIYRPRPRELQRLTVSAAIRQSRE